MSSNRNIPSSFRCLPWIDDYGIKKLLCAIIQVAVDDYRVARKRGFIIGDKVYIDTRIGKLRTMDQVSELNSLIEFFYRGGLQALIDAGNLKDGRGMILDATSITNAM